MLTSRLLVALTLAATLAACGDPQVATVSGGECKVIQRAAVEVCGLTEQDQAFIDNSIEGGIAACRFARPQARTPSCAALRAEIAELRLSVSTPMPVKVPTKRKTWHDYLHRRK